MSCCCLVAWQAINLVCERLTEDDPGLVVVPGTAAQVHTALGVAHSPVPQGMNPDASLAAFTAWIVNEANLAGVGVERVPGALAWGHLSEATALNLCYGRFLIIPWCAALRTAGIPGQVAQVLFITGTGRERASIMVLPQIFG